MNMNLKINLEYNKSIDNIAYLKEKIKSQKIIILNENKNLNIFNQNEYIYKILISQNKNFYDIIEMIKKNNIFFMNFDNCNDKFLSNTDLCFNSNSLNNDDDVSKFSEKSNFINKNFTNNSFEIYSISRETTCKDICDYEIFESNKELKNKNNKKRIKYNIRDNIEKMEILKYEKKFGIQSTSKEYGITKNCIVRWKKNGIINKRKSGRKLKDLKMEKDLIIWIKEYYMKNKNYPNSDLIINESLKLSNYTKFKASKGWLDKFYNRNPKFKI